jgi:hypothetical protein
VPIANSAHDPQSPHQIGSSCTPPRRSPTRLVSEGHPLPAQSLCASRLSRLLALYFVCKWLSSFALQVQKQVSGHEDRGGNLEASWVRCAGTRLADMLGRLRATQGLQPPVTPL